MQTFNYTARLFADSFTLSRRNNGEPFYTCNGPDWCAHTVRAAHDDELPNDLRYELIREAALRVAEYDSADEAIEGATEDAWELCPCAHSELLDWFADNVSRLGYWDDGAELFVPSDASPIAQLQATYRMAAYGVLLVIIREIDANRSIAFNPDTDCRLILSDSHGQYIPQFFCADFTQADAEAMGVNWDDVQVCQTGPNNENYWDAWQGILDAAESTDSHGVKWRLAQNGDLWEIRADAEIPGDWFA